MSLLASRPAGTLTCHALPRYTGDSRVQLDRVNVYFNEVCSMTLAPITPQKSAHPDAPFLMLGVGEEVCSTRRAR